MWLNEVSIIITVEMIEENKVVKRLLIKSSSESHGVSGGKRPGKLPIKM